ncbi:hypothetical protein V6N12_061547 [Hibiscus sabdariffa]|uniref:Uncharacterized protein n=1 Tax=Hibiscus sabdariffa TaxID=183260 RepID=A0ABR2DXD8_9ROSI
MVDTNTEPATVEHQMPDSSTVSQPVYYTAPPQHFAYNAFPQLVSQASSHVAGFPPHSVRSSNTMTPHMVPQTVQPMPSISHSQYAVPTMTSTSSSASPQAFNLKL